MIAVDEKPYRGPEPKRGRHVHPGYCVNIDGEFWHQIGEKCRCCGWGIDADMHPGGTKDVTSWACWKNGADE